MNKEGYSKLNTNLKNTNFLIDLNNNYLLFKNKIFRKKESKTFNFLFFSIILLFIIVILFIIHIYTKQSNLIYNNSSLYYDEPSDDYNIIYNNSSLQNNILINISLPNETIMKYVDNSLNCYLTQEMVDKFNKFTNSCHNGLLLDNTKYPLLKNPKISVIIPLHNGGKYLYYSLRSVQNQKMKEIEIIFVDDCSTDDTIEII